MAKADVHGMEDEILYLVETDINNPKIYELLKSLAYIYVRQNGYNKGYFGVEDVCHDVAADIYLKLRSGHQITKFMSYIGTCLKLSYVKNQKKLEHETIDTNDDPRLHEGLINMCAGSAKSSLLDMIRVQQSMFLNNIDAIIRSTLEKTKFKSGSKDWMTIYTNVCLTLYYGKPTYFRIAPHLKRYIPIIINQFKKEFYNSSTNNQLFNDNDYELDLLYDNQNNDDNSYYNANKT